MKRMTFMIQRREELGLSDEQVRRLEAIRDKGEKKAIRQQAEIEVLKVDLRRALRGDLLDTRRVENLLDKEYSLKKDLAKGLVGGLGEAQRVLSASQRETIRKIRRP